MIISNNPWFSYKRAGYTGWSLAISSLWIQIRPTM